jgi:PAT family beta-lactamase induction signal transducer AmpG
LIVSEALILISANHLGWPISYTMMAVLMGVGMAATVAAIEPTRVGGAASATAAGLRSVRGFADAVIGPFSQFFRTYGWVALLMLAMISLYRLPEFLMGPMANPYYRDLGLSKDTVGAVRASIGLVGSLLGIAAGGVSAVKIGYFRTMIVGLILQSIVIAAFAILAYTGPDVRVFATVMVCDNFGAAFAGVALVTYMSSLTTMGYTATQYALLSSAYTYVGKFAKGFSGVMVESLASGRTLLEGYALFFIGAGLLGVPALVLCVILARVERRRLEAAEGAELTGRS